MPIGGFASPNAGVSFEGVGGVSIRRRAASTSPLSIRALQIIQTQVVM